MNILVIAEHDNTTLKPATLNTIAAAAKLGGTVHVLVAGMGCESVAAAAAQVAGVAAVKLAQAPQLEIGLAENMAAQVLALASDYTAFVFPATASGKNISPRVAALLDVAQISDILSVESATAPYTFTRPMYAGNVIATVQTSDTKLDGFVCSASG